MYQKKPNQMISDDVVIGEGAQIYSFVNLYGCSIGAQTKVGTFVEVQRGASIGAYCKISSHSFICEGVNIKDGVFIGHGVMFTNDKFPKALNPDGTMQNAEDWRTVETYVEKNASIGSGAVILCGVTIGEGALVGAGSVVTKSIPAGECWAGNPARFLRKLKV